MTLALSDSLVNTINAEGVIYCHWKSNFTLSQALCGETDLDFLVERNSLPQTLAVLMDLGFKQAVSRHEPSTPNISHFYGLDLQTGRLIHLHLFSRVVTGESFVKSHLLPLETMLLKNRTRIGKVYVASRPAELVVFILRTYIKFGSILDLKYLLRDSKEIGAEFQWLRSTGNVSESAALLQEYCSEVDQSLFFECMDTLNQPSSLARKVRLARRVRCRLRDYARFTAFTRGFAYARMLFGEGYQRLGGLIRGKALATGGKVIAFVGPEASGKSTLVAATRIWLGESFAVRTVHAGKPPSSWLTLPVNMAFPLARVVMPRLHISWNQRNGSFSDSVYTRSKVSFLSSLVQAFAAVVLAWDRRQLLLRIRRLATDGEIIICDRYPSEGTGAQDSPRLHKDSFKGGIRSALYNWLARIEHRMYDQIPPPDITLRLHTPLDTARQRNRERTKSGKETDDYLEFRHGENREWRRSGTGHIYDINTDQPIAETTLRVMAAIWESL